MSARLVLRTRSFHGGAVVLRAYFPVVPLRSFSTTKPVNPALDDSGENIESRLDRLYDENEMNKLSAPVFSSKELYKKSLPVRDFGKTKINGNDFQTLYKYPFFANECDLKNAAEHLETNKRRYHSGRQYVRYVCGKPMYGKTASILPIYLQSAESDRQERFSHYIYLAFSNNGDRNFSFKSNEDGSGELFTLGDPLADGALFIYEPLKAFLSGAAGADINPRNISDLPGELPYVNRNTGSVPLYTRKINELLVDAGFTAQHKILVHIDEHRGMSDSLSFRKGAVATLASVGGVTVVGTYVAVLDSAKRPGSSGVCRYPIGNPPLNIGRVMSVIDDFAVDKYTNSKDATTQSMLASLRFQLAYIFTYTLPTTDLHSPSPGKMYLIFKDSFRKTVHQQLGNNSRKFATDKKALRELSNLCARTIGPSIADPPEEDSETSDLAAKLLVGIDEAKYNDRSDLGSLVVLEGKGKATLTLSLGTLLRLGDKNIYDVYESGRSLLASQLCSENKMLLASSPLEAAFAWVLSCKSALHGMLKFGGKSARIKCEQLEGGRLFAKTSSEEYSVHPEELDSTTIYFAKDQPDTHPLCDIFFRSNANQLVLINVTGGSWEQVEKKRGDLSDWITRQETNLKNRGIKSVLGAVLAPNAVLPAEEGITTKIGSRSFVVVECGGRAVRQLGGLAQIYKWLNRY